jgi:hypothetical protein
MLKKDQLLLLQVSALCDLLSNVLLPLIEWYLLCCGCFHFFTSVEICSAVSHEKTTIVAFGNTTSNE